MVETSCSLLKVDQTYHNTGRNPIEAYPRRSRRTKAMQAAEDRSVPHVDPLNSLACIAALDADSNEHNMQLTTMKHDTTAQTIKPSINSSINVSTSQQADEFMDRFFAAVMAGVMSPETAVAATHQGTHRQRVQHLSIEELRRIGCRPIDWHFIYAQRERERAQNNPHNPFFVSPRQPLPPWLIVLPEWKYPGRNQLRYLIPAPLIFEAPDR